jgi:hypothetical protein
MKIVPHWKNFWKAFSVQAMTISLAIQGAWTQMPPDMKAGIPDSLVKWVAMGVLGLGIAGWFVKQKTVSGE